MSLRAFENRKMMFLLPVTIVSLLKRDFRLCMIFSIWSVHPPLYCTVQITMVLSTLFSPGKGKRAC